MNVTILIGNVATDPELRHTANGRAVCTFRLAISRPGGEEADFVTVVAWERQGEVCAQYLSTGRRVAVEGRLHQSTWETEDGRRSRIEVVAHRVELLGRPKESADIAAAAVAEETPAAEAELALA
ncbi:MAG: hypothetical protein JWO69_1577 [Thermoleophilia bacterium]|jgi:single-strand DNA-binding protein|nr:hypothetical protein [Thermoleophilia bacterium]